MFHISNLTPDSFVEGADPPEVLRPRKRQRKVLSCDSCHKQKVKCDRQQPCSRCIAGNRANQCTYSSPNGGPASTTHTAPPVQQPSPATSDGTNISQKSAKPPIATAYKKGRARFSGLTHWAQLAFKIEEAAPFIRGDPRELASLINRMKALKSLYPPKRLRPFPFGDSGLNSGLSTLPRLSFLPDRGLAEQLIDNYFNTFERSFPLMDADEFRIELANFWSRPEVVGDAWLSQFYMMLALSCYASPAISFQDVQDGYIGLSERCVDGAESALMNRGQFMTKPDLTTLRVLCLVSVGKQLDLVTLDDSDASWVFMGFVMRIGMSMCLHIGPSAFEAMPHNEAMARRRIWNTMMLLDSTTALDSGMPLVLRPEDYDSSSLSQTEPQRNESASTAEAFPNSMLIDEYYQKLLADITPISAAIINKANSTSPKFGPDQIKDYDKRIRHLLRKAEICITSQKAVVDVVLHRCLLAMHQSCGINPDNHCQDFEHCRLTLHESALTLLQLQAALFDDLSYRWLGEIFVRDFGVAGLYVCVGLRSRTYDDSKEGPHSRAVAKTALQRCPEVIKQNLYRSRHYFKMYKAYVALISGLEAMEAGTSIRDALYQAGINVIETVEECMGPRVMNSAAGLSAMVDPMLQLSSGPDINLGYFDTSLPFQEFLGDFLWAP